MLPSFTGFPSLLLLSRVKSQLVLTTSFMRFSLTIFGLDQHSWYLVLLDFLTLVLSGWVKGQRKRVLPTTLARFSLILIGLNHHTGCYLVLLGFLWLHRAEPRVDCADFVFPTSFTGPSSIWVKLNQHECYLVLLGFPLILLGWAKFFSLEFPYFQCFTKDD